MNDRCRCGSGSSALSLEYPCPQCGYKFFIKDSDIDRHRGVRVMCYKCNKIVTVPPEAVCPICGRFSKNVVQIINRYNPVSGMASGESSGSSISNLINKAKDQMNK